MMKSEGSYIREIGEIERYDLLILDDFGLHSFYVATRMALMEIIEDRHGKSQQLLHLNFQ